MEKLGIVSKVNNDCIEVAVHRDSACGEGCAACGLCPSRDMTVTVKSRGNFCVGDEVRLLSEDKKVIKLSALGYLSLTLLIFLGAALGTVLGSEWLAFCLALLFVFAGVFVLKKVSSMRIEIKVEKITR